MLYEKIRQIEFDLNTTCNSFCPPCHRYTKHNGELYLSPYVKFNENLDVSVIDKIFSNHRLVDNVAVDLVGLVGEPVAHPRFFDIVDIIYKHRPNAIINLHTNGGLRTTAFFAELARKLNKTSYVRFALDGLEDTNSIYRIGVDWNKAINNMQAFIDAGGRAIWKYVVFPWNEHQVDEAKKYALSLGCKKFDIRRNVVEKEIDEFMEAADRGFHKKTVGPVGQQIDVKLTQFNKIEDQCFNTESIYVNAHGRVIPCCMVNSSLTYETFRNETLDFLYKESDDWNDLNIVSSLEEIMNNNFWSRLYDSFNSKPCSICINSCNKK